MNAVFEAIWIKKKNSDFLRVLEYFFFIMSPMKTNDNQRESSSVLSVRIAEHHTGELQGQLCWFVGPQGKHLKNCDIIKQLDMNMLRE